MYLAQLFSCAILLMGVHGRSYNIEQSPLYYNIPDPDTHFEEPSTMREEDTHPIRAARERRQVHGAVTYNSDGTSGVNMKLPFAGNDKNMFSAIGGVDFTKNQKVSSGTVGLSYENINGHGLSLTQSHLPGVGDRTAAAGTLNLFHNDNHNLDANAFAARTTLNNPAVPSFNTVGGGLDYMYKNKVGAGLSMARTPLFDKTDYSATGNLNIFRNPTSSLDFKAGLSKSVSPFLPRSSWEPNVGLTFRKFF